LAVGDRVVDHGEREAGLADDLEEQALEVAAGLVLVGLHQGDQVAELAGPPASRQARTDLIGVEAAEVLSALDEVAQLPRRRGRAHVDDRAGGDGDSEAVEEERVGRLERAAMDEEISLLASALTDNDDLDREDRAVMEAPGRGGGAEAQR
jgi:hypothetical protein